MTAKGLGFTPQNNLIVSKTEKVIPNKTEVEVKNVSPELTLDTGDKVKESEVQRSLKALNQGVEALKNSSTTVEKDKVKLLEKLNDSFSNKTVEDISAKVSETVSKVSEDTAKRITDTSDKISEILARVSEATLKSCEESSKKVSEAITKIPEVTLKVDKSGSEKIPESIPVKSTEDKIDKVKDKEPVKEIKEPVVETETVESDSSKICKNSIKFINSITTQFSLEKLDQNFLTLNPKDTDSLNAMLKKFQGLSNTLKLQSNNIKTSGADLNTQVIQETLKKVETYLNFLEDKIPKIESFFSKVPKLEPIDNSKEAQALNKKLSTSYNEFGHLLSIEIERPDFKKDGKGKTKPLIVKANEPLYDGFDKVSTWKKFGVKDDRGIHLRHIIAWDLLKGKLINDIKGKSKEEIVDYLKQQIDENPNTKYLSSDEKEGFKDDLNVKNINEKIWEYAKIIFNDPKNLWPGPGAPNSVIGSASNKINSMFLSVENTKFKSLTTNSLLGENTSFDPKTKRPALDLYLTTMFDPPYYPSNNSIILDKPKWEEAKQRCEELIRELFPEGLFESNLDGDWSKE